MSIEGQGHFFTKYFPGFVCFVLYVDKISGERLQDHWSSGFLAHLSGGLKSELIVYPCSGVCRCRHRSPFSNMNISESSRPITIKFYLKHHWGGGKAAWGFDADKFRTLASMATDSSHRDIMGNVVITFSQMFLIESFSYLQVMMTCMRAWMSSNFDHGLQS